MLALKFYGVVNVIFFISFISDDLNGEKKTGLGAGYIVLIVTAVFVLVLGITGLLICQHHRKAGTYNFKVKSDNFNYQVFYD